MSLCEAFFEAAEDAVFVVDATTRTIAGANARALHDTGYPAGELKGLGIDKLLRRQDGIPFSWDAENACTPTSPHRHGLRLLKKNGEDL